MSRHDHVPPEGVGKTASGYKPLHKWTQLINVKKMETQRDSPGGLPMCTQSEMGQSSKNRGIRAEPNILFYTLRAESVRLTPRK